MSVSVDRLVPGLTVPRQANRRTCAVVAGTLPRLDSQQSHSTAIDAADIILRLEGDPVLGNEQHVGARTTLRIRSGDSIGALPLGNERVVFHCHQGSASMSTMLYNTSLCWQAPAGVLRFSATAVLAVASKKQARNGFAGCEPGLVRSLQLAKLLASSLCGSTAVYEVPHSLALRTAPLGLVIRPAAKHRCPGTGATLSTSRLDIEPAQKLRDNMLDQGVAAPLALPRRRALRRAVVCFSSFIFTPVADDGTNLRRRLVDPLEADVILALTRGSSPVAAPCRSIDTCEPLRRSYRALMPRAVHVSLVPDMNAASLLSGLDRLAHWPLLLSAFNWSGVLRELGPRSETRHYRVPPGEPRRSFVREYGTAGWSAQICATARLGSGYLAPAVGKMSYHCLKNLHSFGRVLRVLREVERARGAAYELVVRARPDMYWIAPHPRLALFLPPPTGGLPVVAPPHAHAWVPIGEDYHGGLNDRHVVLTRPAADAFFSQFETIINGSILAIDPTLRRGYGDHCANPEYLFARTFMHRGIGISRFPAAAYLLCCSASGLKGGCHRPRCIDVPAPSYRPLGADDAHTPSPPPLPGGKYASEVSRAVGVANRLLAQNGTYRRMAGGSVGITAEPSHERDGGARRSSGVHRQQHGD